MVYAFFRPMQVGVVFRAVMLDMTEGKRESHNIDSSHPLNCQYQRMAAQRQCCHHPPCGSQLIRPVGRTDAEVTPRIALNASHRMQVTGSPATETAPSLLLFPLPPPSSETESMWTAKELRVSISSRYHNHQPTCVPTLGPPTAPHPIAGN